jgi:hypothetical protein
MTSFQQGNLSQLRKTFEVPAACYETVAQTLTNSIFREFETSVLVRVFLTIPFGKLPPANRQAVLSLAQAHKVSEQVDERTPVLSLLATSGKRFFWNDRRLSRGHVGIPLVSASFVETVPMIARMLHEFGLGTGWVGAAGGPDFIVSKLGSLSVLFFVPDASTHTDDAGRKVIAAQEFVKAHDIKSVFGVGGAYVDGSVCVILCFTSESFDVQVAKKYEGLANMFKAATVRHVTSGAFFAP